MFARLSPFNCQISPELIRCKDTTFLFPYAFRVQNKAYLLTDATFFMVGEHQ